MVQGVTSPWVVTTRVGGDAARCCQSTRSSRSRWAAAVVIRRVHSLAASVDEKRVPSKRVKLLAASG